ncbi:MAG: response regulator transcription factor [Chloroflexota bacterium]|nr:response regulator transcription factor [Chloroflexota bacterium]
MIRVMLADDHEMMRQGLRAVLQQEDGISIIGDVNSGEALLRQIDKGAQPDVVLMDVQMGGMSGIEATRKLKQLLPDVHVIGLTAIEEDFTIAEMLRAGACSYVIKAAATRELVQAIQAAFVHNPILSPAVQQQLKRYIARKRDAQRHHIIQADGENLTKRELDVMKLLMKGQSNKEIARRLVISERTVQTHLSNIFAKMAVASRTEAVLVALRDGWMPKNQM